MDYCVELLYSCLRLDNELLKLMSGAVSIPDWLPAQYRDPRHSFETGMDRLRYCGPALVTSWGVIQSKPLPPDV